jgi:hypothetical protein
MVSGFGNDDFFFPVPWNLTVTVNFPVDDVARVLPPTIRTTDKSLYVDGHIQLDAEIPIAIVAVKLLIDPVQVQPPFVNF